MDEKENNLLLAALKYENGHNRRTQHIIKVYTLAKSIACRQNLNGADCRVLCAAAILHDIAIRYCKENCTDGATVENQKLYAPDLAAAFLEQAGYDKRDFEEIIYLIVHHHDYKMEKSMSLQILIEADLLINGFEKGYENIDCEKMKNIFKTQTGLDLLASFSNI